MNKLKVGKALFGMVAEDGRFLLGNDPNYLLGEAARLRDSYSMNPKKFRLFYTSPSTGIITKPEGKRIGKAPQNLTKKEPDRYDFIMLVQEKRPYETPYPYDFYLCGATMTDEIITQSDAVKAVYKKLTDFGYQIGAIYSINYRWLTTVGEETRNISTDDKYRLDIMNPDFFFMDLDQSADPYNIKNPIFTADEHDLEFNLFRAEWLNRNTKEKKKKATKTPYIPPVTLPDDIPTIDLDHSYPHPTNGMPEPIPGYEAPLPDPYKDING